MVYNLKPFSEIIFRLEISRLIYDNLFDNINLLFII